MTAVSVISIQVSDYAGYSALHSASSIISAYSGDTAVLDAGKELNASVIIDLSAGDSVLVQVSHRVMVKTVQADGNGVYVESEIPFYNILTAYSPDGYVKMVQQDNITVFTVYDLKTDIDNWYMVGNELRHIHNIPVKPYATIYIKYLG